MKTTTEERLKILQMLEEGKITANEASTLLRALGGKRHRTSQAGERDGSNRYLRIHVSDLASGKSKVNVTLPIGLVNVGMRIAERFAPEFDGLDMQEIGDLLTSGVNGKIVEVMDEEDNEMVEIYIE